MLAAVAVSAIVLNVALGALLTIYARRCASLPNRSRAWPRPKRCAFFPPETPSLPISTVYRIASGGKI
jgi:hypothetical protein